MTGLELLKAPGTTPEEIADIISEHCPPLAPENCDDLSCRRCWLAWLAGTDPKEKGPSDKQTAPDEEGLHPNLAEMYARAHRTAKQMLHTYSDCGAGPTPPSSDPRSQQ